MHYFVGSLVSDTLRFARVCVLFRVVRMGLPPAQCPARQFVSSDETFAQGVNDVNKIDSLLRDERNAQGLSLRALSAKIGVSFSTLARIERGEGEPDTNTRIRLIEWLGPRAAEAGLHLEDVSYAHFRAAKGVTSTTISSLVDVSQRIRRQLSADPLDTGWTHFDESEPYSSMNKDDMEELANSIRTHLSVEPNEAIDPLKLRIEGVQVVELDDIDGLSKSSKFHLNVTGANDWSAMTIPLSYQQGLWAIVMNRTHSDTRQRVTYLEEFWHIYLGHKPTKIARVGDSFGRTYIADEEHDAYYLAAALMLPKTVVEEAVSEKRSADDVSRKYGTSKQLFEFRVKRLGLWSNYREMNVLLNK